MLIAAQIIRQVTASVSNIWRFPSEIQSIVIGTYVQGLRYTYRTSAQFSLLVSSVHRLSIYVNDPGRQW